MELSKLIMNLRGSKIFAGSLVLLICINIFSLLNFVYNFLMARFLSLEDYGLFSVLSSIILFFAIFSETIQTVVAKYTSKEKDPGKLKFIVLKSLKRSFIYGISLVILFGLLSFPLSSFLDIQLSLVMFAGLMILANFMTPVTRGIMQGRQLFSNFGINAIIEGIVKVASGTILVALGFKVYGAIGGIVTGAFFAFFVSILSLYDIFIGKSKETKTPNIKGYSVQVLITNFVILFLLSIDLILAKRFFSGDNLGIYAVMSTLAKIVFMATTPIARAMFPISSSQNSKESTKSFLQSLLLTLPLVLLFILIIVLIPDKIITLYVGESISFSNISFLYLSLAFSAISFANLNLFYLLSRNLSKRIWTIIIMLPISVILLWFMAKGFDLYSLAVLAYSVIFLIITILLSKNENSNSNSSI